MKAKDFVDFMSTQNYNIYSGIYSEYFKSIISNTDYFIEAITDKSAVGVAAGLKIGGLRSVVLINDLYNFLRMSVLLEKDYGVTLFGILPEDKFDSALLRKHGIKYIFNNRRLKSNLQKTLQEADTEKTCVLVMGKDYLDD